MQSILANQKVFPVNVDKLPMYGPSRVARSIVLEWLFLSTANLCFDSQKLI